MTAALKGMGLDFLNSYIKMVDGEKDPRNLLLLFSMARVILLEFDVEAVIEVRFSPLDSWLAIDNELCRIYSTSLSATSPSRSDHPRTIPTVSPQTT